MLGRARLRRPSGPAHLLVCEDHVALGPAAVVGSGALGDGSGGRRRHGFAGAPQTLIAKSRVHDATEPIGVDK
jgi:hypothetical protein